MNLAIILAFLPVGFTGADAAAATKGDRCTVSKPQVTRKTVEDCRIVTRTATVKNQRTHHEVTLSGDELVCGKIRLGSWKRLVSEAVELCKESPSSEMPFEMSVGFDVVSRHGRFVGVDLAEGGFTGGAHPYASIQRRTYNRRTGRPSRLADVIPKEYERVIEVARQAFRKDARRADYAWEPKAFAFDGRVVRFAFPHAVEVVRGSTLDVNVPIDAL